jgi:hypothetical protein
MIYFTREDSSRATEKMSAPTRHPIREYLLICTGLSSLVANGHQFEYLHVPYRWRIIIFTELGLRNKK